MDPVRKAVTRPERGAALLIVLAFVVLLTGVSVAYLSRTTSDRQVAHGSFNQSKADQMVASAVDNIIGDLRQEVANGSSRTTYGSGNNIYNVYAPTSAANMVPQRSGNAAIAPNLVRRSVSPDNIASPGLPSFASGVNSAPADPANPKRGDVTRARWNRHYLVPKANTGDDSTDPVAGFTAPDWVFVTSDPNNQTAGRKIITGPDQTVIGRYAYAVYDEGALLDVNVAGYPTDPSTAPTPAQRVGRKGSLAYADLTALGNYPIHNGEAGSAYQVDRLVGWRNYATTGQADTNNNNFPDSQPTSKAFARNFQGGSVPATNYYSYVVNNPTGFLSPSAALGSNGRSDQMFVQRQELLAYRGTPNTNNGTPIAGTSQFDVNALQYLNTFSRETNSPSVSPPAPTATNPNFLTIRVATSFTRFDGTTSVVGEPLVETRFPLSRLAWITYQGPSALRTLPPQSPVLLTTDPNYDMWALQWIYWIPASYLRAGTAANIKACFGLVWDSRGYLPGANPPIGQQWVYDSPSSANTGGSFDPLTNPSGNPASDIKRLDVVVSENREPDFFELLRATILDGSLGQDTGGGVTGVTPPDPTKVFPDLHMSNKALHILTIGACIIDQADLDSVPTRIQFRRTIVSPWWTAYGVESLPYITQIYPIAGTSPVDPTKWATYLLFQLWNPHVGPALSPTAPQVRIRADGGIGMFTGGNGQTWASATDKQTMVANGGLNSVQNMPLTAGVLPPTLPTPTPIPLGTPGVASVPAVGSVPVSAQCGFERLPGSGGNSLTNYVGLRLLPDYPLTPAASGSNPQLNLYFGTDVAHQFNATMEYLISGTTSWVPYNHFIGINDSSSWINGDTVPVRNASSLNGRPSSGDAFDNNAGNRLTSDFPLPDCLMKADPRATRFGIFQFRQSLSNTTPRLKDALWLVGSSNYPNGYGGTIADPGGPVQHAPRRFSTSGGGNQIYFPATLCINNAGSTATRTGYADVDGVIRPADVTFTEAPLTGSSTGSATPYYATTTSGSADYHPIILNRPFRNVAELGYAFRDLPWKTLDFFTDKSADAGLLDAFCVNDGSPVVNSNGNIIGMAVPTIVAGQVNLNTTQASDLQSAFAGTILDEISSTTVNKTGTGATDAPVLAANVVNATSTTRMQNRSELITRSTLPTSILPVPFSGAVHDQRVKSRREVVARATASVSQTRTWSFLIDVVAQSGHYKPNASSLPNDFVVEGEQHYWVHVAIDRFTGQVIDKQIEVVNE
jgi:hypothetical protein